MISYEKFSQDFPRRALYCATLSVGAVAVFLCAFLIVKTVHASVETANLKDQFYGPSVSVRGHGKVVVTPESASFVSTFSFGVQTTSESVETAQAEATRRINDAIGYLKSEGVKEEDIQTTAYNVYPHYEWIQEPCVRGVCPPGQSVPTGFDVSQTVTVKVRDIKKSGDLLTGIGKREVTNISGLSFTVDDIEKVRDEARKMAIADAKERAEALADDLGVDLDRIQGMYEVQDGGPYPMYEAYGGDMAMGAVKAAAPEVSPGSQEIEVTIEIAYSIDN